MHNRNKFHPDRYELIEELKRLRKVYPELRKWLKPFRKSGGGKGGEELSWRLDFKDPSAVRALTNCHLTEYFSLKKLELLPNSLCPALPNRLNYLHWVEDLFQLYPTTTGQPSNSNPVTTEDKDNSGERSLHGLDIGTGASCIYPLLACRLHPNWSMTGTDIDRDSLQVAQRNIVTNQLQSRIHLITIDPPENPIESPKQTPIEPIKPEKFQIFPSHVFSPRERATEEGSTLTPVYYDFVVCNPPFYDSVEAKAHPTCTKRRPPAGEFRGTNNEVATPGGEKQFLTRMVKESLHYRDQVGWFTTMTGMKATVTTILNQLQSHQVDTYVVSKLTQGQTNRWVVGWTFHPHLYQNKSPTCHTLSLKRKRDLDTYHLTPLPPPPSNLPLSHTIPLPHPIHLTTLQSHFTKVGVDTHPDPSQPYHVLTGHVTIPTWTRTYRRHPTTTPPIPPFNFNATLTNPSTTPIPCTTPTTLPCTITLSLITPNPYLHPHFDSMCHHLRNYLTQL